MAICWNKAPRAVLADRPPKGRCRRQDMSQTLEAIKTTQKENVIGGKATMDMNNVLICFLYDRKGTASLEYGLIAAGIAIAILASVQSLNAELSEIYNTILTGIQALS
jgi:pilus assembly protein Flp/PilA